MASSSTTLFLGNLDGAQVTRRHLYELGIQAGPVRHVNIPKDSQYGFIEFEDAPGCPAEQSCAYAKSLLEGQLVLFGRRVNVAYSSKGGRTGTSTPSQGSQPLQEAMQDQQQQQREPYLQLLQQHTQQQHHAAHMQQQQQQQAYMQQQQHKQHQHYLAQQQQHLQVPPPPPAY